MSTVYPFAIEPLPLQAAVQRTWAIRRLWRERAIDARAADLALKALREHPNLRVQVLARETACEIVAQSNAPAVAIGAPMAFSKVTR